MHTIPKHLGEFTALAQGKTDYTVQVIHTNPESYGDLMTICATEGAVYITREQAKAFFGLVEPLPFNVGDKPPQVGLDCPVMQKNLTEKTND